MFYHVLSCVLKKHNGIALMKSMETWRHFTTLEENLVMEKVILVEKAILEGAI